MAKALRKIVCRCRLWVYSEQRRRWVPVSRCPCPRGYYHPDPNDPPQHGGCSYPGATCYNPCSPQGNCPGSYCSYQCVDGQWQKQLPDCPSGCTCPDPIGFDRKCPDGAILLIWSERRKASKPTKKKSAKKKAAR